jgi:hypothetical protein
MSLIGVRHDNGAAGSGPVSPEQPTGEGERADSTT